VKKADSIEELMSEDANQEQVVEPVVEPEVMSEKVSAQADKFIGKDLSDQLEARFDNGEFAKLGLTKEEFFHKSAMIRAYMPVSDEKFGDLLEEMAAGNELSAENSEYVSEVLNDIDAYSKYGKEFGDTLEAQKLFDDVMNNHEKMVVDGELSRREVFDKLAELKENNPEEFNARLEQYKSGDFKDIADTELSDEKPETKIDAKVENASKSDLDENNLETDFSSRQRLINEMYKAQDPSGEMPIKAGVEMIDGKEVETVEFDRSKLSPEAKLAFKNEVALRIKELGLGADATQDQIDDVIASVENDAFEAFSYDFAEDHEKVYNDNLTSKLEDKIPESKKTTPVVDLPTGDSNSVKVDSKDINVNKDGVKATGNETKVTKTTVNDDGSVTKETLTRKTSSGVISAASLDNYSKDHIQKLTELGMYANEDHMHMGRSMGMRQGQVDMMNNVTDEKLDYSDDVEKFCERKGITIKIDGQGFGIYEFEDGKTDYYINEQYMTDQDKALYKKMVEQNTDKSGEVDKFGAKYDFLQEKMNPEKEHYFDKEKNDEEIKRLEEELKKIQDEKAKTFQDSSEKPKKEGFFKRLFGGKDKAEITVPKIETDASGDAIKPESSFKSGESNLDDKKTDLSNRKALLDNAKNPDTSNIEKGLDASSKDYSAEATKRFSKSLYSATNGANTGIVDGKVDLSKMSPEVEKIYAQEYILRQQEQGISNGDAGADKFRKDFNNEYIKANKLLENAKAAQLAKQAAAR